MWVSVDQQRRQTTDVSSKRLLLPEVDTARCTGCGRCVAACRPHLLFLETQGWKKFSTLQDQERCTGCGACALACPFNALAIREAESA